MSAVAEFQGRKFAIGEQYDFHWCPHSNDNAVITGTVRKVDRLGVEIVPRNPMFVFHFNEFILHWILGRSDRRRLVASMPAPVPSEDFEGCSQ